PFLNDSDNLEEIQENREQIEISMMYERMPKPTLMATQEFSDDKTYWRIPDAPEKPL
ncbi:MAG: DNA-directed RNA polymerase subunit omega, partial [Bacteroidota bacterium]